MIDESKRTNSTTTQSSATHDPIHSEACDSFVLARVLLVVSSSTVGADSTISGVSSYTISQSSEASDERCEGTFEHIGAYVSGEVRDGRGAGDGGLADGPCTPHSRRDGRDGLSRTMWYGVR